MGRVTESDKASLPKTKDQYWDLCEEILGQESKLPNRNWSAVQALTFAVCRRIIADRMHGELIERFRLTQKWYEEGEVYWFYQPEEASARVLV